MKPHPADSERDKLTQRDTSLQATRVRVPVAIALGAIAGSLSRYTLTATIGQQINTAFPTGTFCVNLLGAFAMGIFANLAVRKRQFSPEVKLIVATGFLSSFTTFSAYELESEQLLFSHSIFVTLLYWTGSAVLGVLCLYLGTRLSQKIW